MKEIIKTNIKGLYCNKNNGLIEYSILRLNVENGYGAGTENETLHKMLKDMTKLKIDIEKRISEVIKVLNNSNKLF